MLRNNIFYLNWLSSSPEGGTIQGGGTLTYSNIYNRDSSTYTPPPNATNFKRYPSFVNPASGDFSLRYFSPSVDSGDPSDSFALEPVPNGNRINQGHQGNTLLVPDHWNLPATGGWIASGPVPSPSGIAWIGTIALLNVAVFYQALENRFNFS